MKKIYFGHEMLLGVTVLLSLTVFQQTVSETMPITSLQIPLLGNIWNIQSQATTHLLQNNGDI